MDSLMNCVRFVKGSGPRQERKKSRVGVKGKVLFLATMIMVASYSFVAVAAPTGSQQPPSVKYCIYKYVISDEKVPVCSQYPLTGRDLRVLSRQFDYSCYLYRKFAKLRGHTLPQQTVLELDVYLTTQAHLNNPKYFPRHKSGNDVVGRYVNGNADIFLTRRVFTSDGITDLPHELGHWFNDMLKIKDKALNEQLAKDFEKYYAAETR